MIYSSKKFGIQFKTTMNLLYNDLKDRDIRISKIKNLLKEISDNGEMFSVPFGSWDRDKSDHSIGTQSTKNYFLNRVNRGDIFKTQFIHDKCFCVV